MLSKLLAVPVLSVDLTNLLACELVPQFDFSGGRRSEVGVYVVLILDRYHIAGVMAANVVSLEVLYDQRPPRVAVLVPPVFGRAVSMVHVLMERKAASIELWRIHFVSRHADVVHASDAALADDKQVQVFPVEDPVRIDLSELRLWMLQVCETDFSTLTVDQVYLAGDLKHNQVIAEYRMEEQARDGADPRSLVSRLQDASDVDRVLE